MKLTNKILAVSIALGTLFSGSSAMASNAVSGTNYDVGTYLYQRGGYFYVQAGSIYAAGDYRDMHSTVVTEQLTTREATMAQIGMIQNHLDGSSMGAITPTGGNGGALNKRFSMLGRFDWRNMKEDITGAAWKANLYSFALGGDYKVNDRVALGLALTYSFLDGDTSFNRGKMRDQAWGVVPFVRVAANKWLGFDIIGGYSRVSKKRTRVVQYNETSALNGTAVEGTPKSNRWFGAIFANMTHNVNKLNLLARLGYNHMEDKQKAFSENNGKKYVAQTIKGNSGHLRLQAGYDVTRTFQPFMFGTYDYYRVDKVKLNDGVNLDKSVNRNPNFNTKRGKNVYGGGLGLNIAGANNVTGGVEYGYKQAKDFKVHDLTMKVKYEF